MCDSAEGILIAWDRIGAHSSAGELSYHLKIIY